MQRQTSTQISSGSELKPGAGGGVVINLSFGIIFAENCMKFLKKKIGVAEGVHSSPPHP